MIPWLILGELAIFACGLLWLPFGIAINSRVDPSAVCPASAGAARCLDNIFNWGLVPFIPGELLKMFFVLVTVPVLWKLTLEITLWWRRKYTGPPTSAAAGNFSQAPVATEVMPFAATTAKLNAVSDDACSMPSVDAVPTAARTATEIVLEVS
jgi:hypothetical protein